MYYFRDKLRVTPLIILKQYQVSTIEAQVFIQTLTNITATQKSFAGSCTTLFPFTTQKIRDFLLLQLGCWYVFLSLHTVKENTGVIAAPPVLLERLFHSTDALHPSSFSAPVPPLLFINWKILCCYIGLLLQGFPLKSFCCFLQRNTLISGSFFSSG